jgi:tripartite-type tricarboxylate transporter receptor subunit TctC
MTSLKRAPGWTDVPTINEAGVKGYEMDAWYAILVPSGTAPPLVERLNKAMAQALHTTDVQEKLAGLGMGAVASSSVDAAKYIDNERQKWGKVVKAANIRAD